MNDTDSEGAPDGRSPQLYQRCLRCGTDEATGFFCTWCRTAAYDLIEHSHTSGGIRGNASCPLGPYQNPGSTNAGTPSNRLRLAQAVAAWRATHGPDFAEPYITRRWRHPARSLVVDRTGRQTRPLQRKAA